MADSLANFVTTGKGNFGDLVKSILADLVKMEARILISRVLTSLFMRSGTTIASNYMAGGGATYAASGVNWNVGTLGTNANGGVYSSPSLSQYSGGVYDSPRFFTFANGGVFGEAGPEAIMPLSRGPDGKLGVKGAGSNVTVIVENHSDSKAEVSQSKDSNGNDILKVMIGAAVNEVNKQIGRGGSTAQVLQQTFGLSRRGVPVAG